MSRMNWEIANRRARASGPSTINISSTRTWHPLVAKYESDCERCGLPILAGSQALYNPRQAPGKKMRHTDCKAKAERLKLAFQRSLVESWI